MIVSAAAFLELSGGAEQLLGDFQRAVVQPAGHRPPAARAADVEGAAEARQRVQQHDDVAAELDLPLAALDHQLREVDVLVDRVVVASWRRPCPGTLRFMSVTSSGRSSISRRNSCTFG